MAENNHLEQQTEKQKENLANTIATKKGISLYVGYNELRKAMSGGAEKPMKKNHNTNQISEELEQFEKKLSKKRPPIIIN